MWSRPQIKTKDHEVYRAYAEYLGLKVHGAYRMAIESALEFDNLYYEDGQIKRCKEAER